MKYIVTISQKGGVGKSVLTSEILWSLKRSDIQTAFIDLDQQGGIPHKPDKNPNAEVCVIDTPGALQSKMASWMQQADVIVIPTRATSMDIEPLRRMQQAVAANAPDKPVIYVINCWNRWRASSDFREWMTKQRRFSDAQILTIPQSEQLVKACAMGKSVIELGRRSNIAKSMMEFINKIRESIGIAHEK